MRAVKFPRLSEERQRHLSRKEMINFGAYYTAPEYVQTVRRMLIRNGVPNGAIILDNACGYGGFLCLRDRDIVGCDIDEKAAARARMLHPHATVFCADSLRNVSRKQFNIGADSPLVVVGNPPFNDKTSQIRRDIKTAETRADADIATRDTGISFMRAFDKLRADIVCVLHPLSYLIKRANFSLLGNFAKNYALRDASVINSADFPGNSRHISFPLTAALYVRDDAGMRYETIRRFRFRTARADFALDDFQYLGDFARKYPRRREESDLDGIAFYPMRDINALRRNRTFLFSQSGGVFMNREQLRYYIYADVFKQYARRLPYYFGNHDVMINAPLFRRREKHFIADALRRHPRLREYVAAPAFSDETAQKINEYFYQLLGEHYLAKNENVRVAKN